MTLRAGDTVRYVAHPEWGSGVIDWTTPTVVHATFPEAHPTYSGEFHPGELKHQAVSNLQPRVRRTR